MMSSDTPELDGETIDDNENDDLSLIGLFTVGVRWAYNNPAIGFGMDMVGLGTLAFTAVFGAMAGILFLSNFVGGWFGVYGLFVATFGTYGAYRKRLC